jgi:hypothetical protein
VSPSTASTHLAKLVAGGLLKVERHGRHRYYRLTGDEVGAVLEAVARIAPPLPVRSLREGTVAQRLRTARSCYDHLAGRLGVDLMQALLAKGWLVGGDGRFRPSRASLDRLSGSGLDCDYRATETGWAGLDGMGVVIGTIQGAVRYCIDWSEQDHHLAGPLGRALLTRFLEAGWVVRRPTGRALLVTPAGAEVLRLEFGLSWPEPPAPADRAGGVSRGV